MGRQINAGVLFLINKVKISIYRFLTSEAKKIKKQPQPGRKGFWKRKSAFCTPRSGRGTSRSVPWLVESIG